MKHFSGPWVIGLIMKTKTLFIAAVMGLGVSGVMFAADAAGESQKVQVKFVDAEKFSDVRDAYMPSEKGQAAYLDIIRRYVEEEAGRYVGDGQKLEVNFTNIDMAGDFEPWHKPGMEDVRIIKGIYPPRVDLNFKLTDAAGKVLKEGSRELRDSSFMMQQMHLTLRHNEALNFEKEMLKKWIKNDIKSAKTD